MTAQITQPEFAVPAELEAKYEVTSVIGVGGMGVVLKARHRMTNQIVAIKLLRSDKATHSTGLLRFRQEAEAASKLSHPNVVVVHDFGVADNVAYLIMEYIDGQDLSHLIRAEKLDAERLKHIFLQVCDGLAHAHRHGIIHRDLKPSNILIKRDHDREIAKIADFGIAKVMTDETTQHLTKTGEICGSPLYMSPEQCIGQAAEFRSDIFSLGCVMYEAITGEVPNAGENTLETIHRRSSEAPRSFTECGITFPGAIERIVMRCLEKNPNDRYQSVAELHDDLLHGRSAWKQRSTPKRRWIVATAVVAVACGFGLAHFTSQVSELDQARTAREHAQQLIEQNKLQDARKMLMAEALPHLKKAQHDNKFISERNAFLGAYDSLRDKEKGVQDPLSALDAVDKKKSTGRVRGRPIMQAMPMPAFVHREDSFAGADEGGDAAVNRARVNNAPSPPLRLAVPSLQGATNGTTGPAGADLRDSERSILERELQY